MLTVSLACGRAPEPVAQQPRRSSSTKTIHLSVNGEVPSQGELQQRLAGATTRSERHKRLSALVDDILISQMIRSLPGYELPEKGPTKPRQELVARFLGEHFAPERFCAALPERDLEWQFKRTRARYVHPDYWVLAGFSADCCAPDEGSPCAGCGQPLELLAARVEAALTEDADTPTRLGDARRSNPNRVDELARWWRALVTPLGLHGGVQRWTLFDDPTRPGAFKPGLRVPGAWRALLGLSAGQRTEVFVGDEALHLWLALETIPARQDGLRDPKVRADVRREVCRSRVTAGKQQLLDDLRKTAVIEGLN